MLCMNLQAFFCTYPILSFHSREISQDVQPEVSLTLSLPWGFVSRKGRFFITILEISKNGSGHQSHSTSAEELNCKLTVAQSGYLGE